jgi:hypothetical protein
MSPVAQTPVLRVRCGARCGGSHSDGHLVVEDGAVRFEFDRAGAGLGLPPVVHARPPLVFMRARLLPPGCNSALILRGAEATVTVFTWWGVRGRVRRALAEAEVAFFERPTWVSVASAHGAGWAARAPRRPATG